MKSTATRATVDEVWSVLADADFARQTRGRESLANHWEIDGNLVAGQNQSAGLMVPAR